LGSESCEHPFSQTPAVTTTTDSMSPTLAPIEHRFAALLETHRGIVFKVANSYCRSPEDRQDLVQDIATQLWRAFPSYDPTRSFSTWMYRIALNVAISYKRDNRAQARTETLEEHHDGHADFAVDDGVARHESDQRIRALHAVIDRQPPLDRALLLLWLDERNQREIAEVLGLSESNVSTKLNRLKQRIREQLAGHDAA
jgi:RNA polymerase sigma factor (sigma-70 family)